MRTTRVFKSGDGQAAAIPDDIAFEDGDALTVTRHGDVVSVSPVLARVGMAETVAKLRAMPEPSSIEIYEPAEFPDRERC